MELGKVYVFQENAVKNFTNKNMLCLSFSLPFDLPPKNYRKLPSKLAVYLGPLELYHTHHSFQNVVPRLET